MNFYRAFSLLSELRPSWGMLLLTIFIVLGFAMALYQTKGGISRKIFSLYVTIAVFDFIPIFNLKLKGISIDSFPWVKLGIFVAVFLVITLLLSRSPLILLDKIKGSFINTFLLSLIGTGLLISTVSVMLPHEIRGEFNNIVSIVFINDFSRFIWVVLPIIASIIL